jgi:hypothetical protein
VTYSIAPAIFLVDAWLRCSRAGSQRESEMRIELPRPRDLWAPDLNAIRRDLSLRLHGPGKAA